MNTLVIFDITSDKIRYKIGETCKDYGLSRIQKSAFFGNINRNRREELYIKLRETLGSKKGDIRIYPVCDRDFRQHKKIINQGD